VAVDLMQPDVDPIIPTCRKVLANVIGTERKFPVPPIAENRESYPIRSSVVEDGVNRCSYGAPGEHHVVDDHDCAPGYLEVKVCCMHHWRDRTRSDVVAIERDIDVAE
jgi:hypothetical protein